MALQLNDTEGLDLKTWLNNNNLGALNEKFEQAGLTIQDMLSNKEEALRELFGYIGCNPIQKIKLITAVKSLPNAVLNQTKEMVFLGEKEQEILEQLNKRSAAISDNMKSLQDAINGLEKSAVVCNKDIHSGCDEMISSIEKYRKILLDNAQNMKNKRKQELESKLNNLKQLNNTVLKSVSECQQIAIGKDNDKCNKMKQIIDKNDSEQKIDVNDCISSTDIRNIKLEIKKDAEQFKSGMEKGLLVQFTDDKLDIVAIESESFKSKMLSSTEARYLLQILPKELKNKEYQLLFKASRDGFAASTFHSKCDNRGETITIIQSTNDNIFGGYTSKPWTSNGGWIDDSQKAFIFALKSQNGNDPQKWKVKSAQAQYTVYHHSSYGPTFGGGHDIYICNNCDSQGSSHSNLGHTYQAPQDKNLLAGSYTFTVKDYEVWLIE